MGYAHLRMVFAQQNSGSNCRNAAIAQSMAKNDDQPHCPQNFRLFLTRIGL
jgi:hypothetical protein